MIFAKHLTGKKIVIIFHRPVKSEERAGGREINFLISRLARRPDIDTVIVDKLDQANPRQVPRIVTLLR